MKKIKFKKGLIFFFPVFLSLFIFYSFYSPGTVKNVSPPPPPPVQNNNIWDKFILGAMSEEWDYQWNYTHSDQLELNVSHIYNYFDSIAWNGGYRLTPIGRTNNDKLLTPINNYKTEVTGYLKDIYDNHNGRRSITMRPKIAWLCYGQSSIYEAEPIDPGNDLWFYSFNENTGTTVRDNEYGGGHDVLQCSISQLGPNGRYEVTSIL